MLRAKYGIKTPDALQIGVGVLHKASKFLTNDSTLKKVADLDVLVLADFVEK